MSSKLKKIIIIIVAIIIVALFFLISVTFFLKEEKQDVISQNNQQEEKPSEDAIIGPTAEEKVKTFAENFTKTHYSYAWGSFSNIESQYYYMTDGMKDREENKVEKMKKGIENQPQKYFTVIAKLTSSDLILYNETKASFKIDLNISSFAVAMIERDTMIWVDENGDHYEGNINDLIVDTVDKNIKIDLVKIDDQWKVDRIEER
ncbi:MAG: hypothetical protein KAI71_05480 [Candidatus Pacebacteria bacterium]|nr:hypothetical protein [Candidatus Paceibacterota bacterium]